LAFAKSYSPSRNQG